MSIIRRAWAQITAFYLATLLVCLALVVPQIKGHMEQELAARSAAAAARAAASYASLPADDERPLRSYATLLRDTAPSGGWDRFEILDAAQVVVVPRAASDVRWAERLAGGWAAASATAPFKHPTLAAGTVRVWVNADRATQVVERCLLAVLAAFAVMGALMMAVLARTVHVAMAPLKDFHNQVRDVSERRFVALKEPLVTEWIELSRALNVMVARVRHMMVERETEVDNLQERLAVDELTQSASRPQFMEALNDSLKTRPEGACVVIVRVHDLDGMNRRAGRSRANDLLVAVATALRTRLMLSGLSEDVKLARLNGADFGMVLPVSEGVAARAHVEQLAQSLSGLASDGLSEGPQVAWIGASVFRQGESLPAVLLRVDAMLVAAETTLQPYSLADPAALPYVIGVAQWRVLIETALDTGRFTLAFFDVRDRGGALIHREAMVRLVDSEGHLVGASDFVPPAIRNGRIADIDLRVIELSLLELARCEGGVAVNVAAQSLRRPMFLMRLEKLLQQHAAVASRLCIEVDERGFDAASLYAAEALCRTVSPFGCHVGIDQFGVTLSMLPILSAAKAQYVKLASALLPGLAHNDRLRGFIGQLAELGRRVGVPVIANGVVSDAERRLLESLGVTGFSGPALLATEAQVPQPA